MKTEKIAIGKLKPSKINPRYIKDNKFKKLVKSIQEFPEMLEIRPIVVNKDMVVLGGNMRLRASILYVSELIYKPLQYYFHERVWYKYIKYGLKKYEQN